MRMARTAVALVCAGACVITAAAGASSAGVPGVRVRRAGVSFGRAVQIGLSANATGNFAFLAAVDCLRGGGCVAGGGYDSRVGAGIRELPMIVTESRGRWARARELALPSLRPGVLVSVDCTGPGSCVALGNYLVPAGSSAAFVVTESRGRWGRVRRLLPPPNATRGARFGADAVACPSPGSCVVVGWYLDSRGDETWAASQSHGRWQAAQEIRPPAGSPASNRGAGPSSVACPRAGACAAAGFYQDAAGALRAFAVSQAGGRWRPAVEVRPPANAGPPDAALASVSCTGVGACVAVGRYTTTSPREVGMIATESGGRWRQARALTLAPPNASATADITMWAIACPTAGSCVAAGTYQTAAAGNPAMYLPESGGTWRTVSVLALPPNAAGVRTVEPSAVDCSGPGSCAIVGDYDTTAGLTEAMGALTR